MPRACETFFINLRGADISLQGKNGWIKTLSSFERRRFPTLTKRVENTRKAEGARFYTRIFCFCRLAHQKPEINL